jgi:hypothetical protein
MAVIFILILAITVRHFGKLPAPTEFVLIIVIARVSPPMTDFNKEIFLSMDDTKTYESCCP